jgi:hypothetical protein
MFDFYTEVSAVDCKFVCSLNVRMCWAFEYEFVLFSKYFIWNCPCNTNKCCDRQTIQRQPEPSQSQYCSRYPLISHYQLYLSSLYLSSYPFVGRFHFLPTDTVDCPLCQFVTVPGSTARVMLYLCPVPDTS